MRITYIKIAIQASVISISFRLILFFLDSIMETANEKSASLSFLSSYPTCWSTNQSTGPEICSDPGEPWLDAEIVVEGKSVVVNRSILSERSQFFHRLFNLRNDGSVSEGKPKYLLTDLVPHGKVGFEAFNDILLYLYTGMTKESPPEVSACVDDACVHVSCPPTINYAVELIYACAAFQITELVSYFQCLLLILAENAPVEDVIPILVAALHCQLNRLHSCCIQRIARSNLDNVCLEKELPDEVSSEIKSLRVKSNQESEANIKEVDPMHEKRVRRIHKALDSDDFELLNLLLNEYEVTLDDAFALHYAAAYCNPKVFKEVLNMGLADLNLKDARGRTVLHVAARRKEPAVLETLLSKGACASETTSDGRTAVAICRRMTRRKDYIEASKQGQETNKDWLCIAFLEREIRRNSMSGNLAMSADVMGDAFQMKLDYLEKKVAGVWLFPSEAREAMEIAGADTATGLSALGRKGLSGNLKEIDLNETPSMQAKRRQLRLLTLLKTVETAHLYFPHCSQVVEMFMDIDSPHCLEMVNEFLDCDWSDASLLEKVSPEERKLERAGFMKLRVDIHEALCKDVAYHRHSRSAFYKYMAEDNRLAFYKYMAEGNRSGMSTSSASSN
ncbi:hypothetical protein CUMW_262410 [Citrus unshiu]|uniref:BTB domain-containing protein n=2 Tax=Citrus TaxID=2706 RepID=A0A2H5QUB9_CITUN|nr:hypothetical protein CUMW_262410 [Citrus unshiu]